MVSSSSTPLTPIEFITSLKGISERLDQDLHADLIERCIHICTIYHLTIDEFCEKWDAYKFAKKYGGKGTAMTLERLDSFENHIKQRVENQNKNKSTTSTTATAAKSRASIGGGGGVRQSKKLNQPSQAADNLLDELLNDGVAVPVPQTIAIKQEIHNNDEKENDMTSILQSMHEHEDGKSENVTATAVVNDYNTPAPQRTRSALTSSNTNTTGIQSSPHSNSIILSTLQRSAIDDKYSQRENSSVIVYTYNETLAPAESSTAEQRMIDIQVIDNNDSESPSQGRKSDTRPYRYMYIEEDDMRHSLEQHYESIQYTICHTNDFKKLVKISNGMVDSKKNDDIVITHSQNISQNESSQDDKENQIKVKHENDANDNGTKEAAVVVKNEGTTIDDESLNSILSLLDDDPESLLLPINTRSHHDSIIVAGRVIVDDYDGTSTQRLTTSNIMLEGDVPISNGKRVNLRVGLLQEYTLFPGQYIVCKGMNESGHTLIAEAILSNAILKHRICSKQELIQYNTNHGNDMSSDSVLLDYQAPLSMMVASGPYSISDTLNYQPLYDLLTCCKRMKPHILVLIGPFVDVEHSSITPPSNTSDTIFNTSTYHDLFYNLLNEILEQLHDIHTRLLVVPSLRDIHHVPVYPQPSFNISHTPYTSLFRSYIDSGKLLLLPNPSTITINDITVGISHSDCIQQLAAQYELHKQDPSKQGQQQQGRMQRIASHLIHQQSYYPVYPSTSIPIDWSSIHSIHMPVSPDILIIPSKTKYFAADIGSHNNVIAINPESVTKSNTAGFYAHITIHPLRSNEIDTVQEVGHHHITARTRVDIIRV